MNTKITQSAYLKSEKICNSYGKTKIVDYYKIVYFINTGADFIN